MRVGVVGAGIGGLSAALPLLDAGFDVHLYEQAAALTDVGAGVQVSPNASGLLRRYGLADRLAATGVKPRALHQRRWDDGRTLLSTPLGEPFEARYGAPYYQVHRADLLSALAGAVPADRIHLNHRLTGVREYPDRVEARFADGGGVEVDVLVGADGIHSAVRRELLGPDAPRFTGCVAYRGLVPADRVAELDLEVTADVWMGPAAHVVHYFVGAQRLVNVVAVVERDSWTRESWTDRADPAEALDRFAGWHPQVRTLLAAIDETFIWALFDRAPLPRWSTGRITLAGDACHPMLPFMAQGAAQAIEDGAALAACLTAAGTDIPAALRRYQRVRLPRTSRLQGMSAANKTRFHLPDGADQQERDAQLASGATDLFFQAMGWIYDHDAAAVDETA